MRIGVLAHETGVSERLLRYYEEQGLLQPARRANGYREYAESDIVAVSHIRYLLAAGLPTTVIAQVLHCVHDDGKQLIPSACQGMVNHLERERARIAEAITQLATAQLALDTLLAAVPGRPDRTEDADPLPPTEASRIRPTRRPRSGSRRSTAHVVDPERETGLDDQ
ncbi:MerR family transcriptional regulator [Dactylosporangium sp. NPDC051485]|uniref:MerR family transcriptional regulator n=1 Tax=Dactylosporangium sp. NPDC051485 TaxID=3154846 RepID=UPI00341BBC4B